MSHSSKPTDSTTNPSTPLSPFPSTPHRLSYIQQQYPNQNSPFNPLDSPIHSNPYDSYNFNTHQFLTDAHISPTKAAQQTRLNHEISTITSWLENLFATPTSDPNSDTVIPPPFLKWKGEVLAAAANSSFDGPVPLLGALSGTTNSTTTSVSTYEGYGHGHGQFTPTRPTQPSRHSSTNTNTNSNSNNPVLESLKSLKQINLSADYLASLLHDARLEELRVLQSQQSQINQHREQQRRARTLLDELHGTLTPDAVDALRSLSESAVILGIDLDHDLDTSIQIQSSGPETRDLTTLYAQGILGEVRRKFILEEQIRDLEGLADRIRSEAIVTEAGKEGDGEDGNHDTQNEQIHAQTAQYNRDTKQINLKIMEYHDRVTSMERQLGSLRTQSVSLQDVLNARARVEDRRARVKALQERFAAFNGLPPDLEDSRSEVKRAMAELESLKKRREGLFERMGTA